MSYSDKVGVTFEDSPSNDAFGRLRVSNPQTLFDSKQLYDSQALFWDDQETSGGGTGSSHSVANATTTISVSASTAGTRVRQTFRRMNYQPGKSQLIFVTFTNFDTATGITKRVGYFDGDNGLYFQSSGGTVSVVRRTKVTGSVVNNPVAQSSWNLDTMDGTGASGIELDFNATQIGIIDFEWLGVGRVRMGWVVDGNIYYCHEFNNANNLTTVYMSTPNLPVRYEISNDGTGGADTFGHICSSVISEGGAQVLGYLRHADSGAVSGLSSGTQYIIMAGRLKSTHLSANIIIENISLIGSANDQAHWELYINGTPGAALTFSDVANSAMQVATGSSSHTHTGGTAVDGGYFTTNIGAGFTVPDASRIGAYIDGTPQVIYLTVTPITNNITVRASVTWRELL